MIELGGSNNYEHACLSAHVLLLMGNCHRLLGNSSLSVAYLDTASRIIQRYANDPPSMRLQANIRLHRALALWNLNQLDEAEKLLQMNLNLADDMLPDEKFKVTNKDALSAVMFAKKEYGAAYLLAQEVKSKAKNHADDDLLGTSNFDSYMNIFFTAFKLGCYDEALRYILNVDVMLKSTKLFKEKDTKDLVVEMTVGTFVKSGNCRKAVQYFQKKSEETKAGQRKIVYRGLPYER